MAKLSLPPTDEARRCHRQRCTTTEHHASQTVAHTYWKKRQLANNDMSLQRTDFWGPVSNFGIPIAAVMDTQKSPELYVPTYLVTRAFGELVGSPSARLRSATNQHLFCFFAL